MNDTQTVCQDPVADADRDAADLYVNTVFGDGTGYACGAVGTRPRLTEKGKYDFGRNWREFNLRWPEQRDELVKAIVGAADARADVYLSPYLRTTADREKGSAIDRRIVHADIDVPVPVKKVEAVGGFVVASGSEGHGHAYIALSAPVSAKEHEHLCRAWARYLVVEADAKISDNDVLRPPGSVNRKPTVRGGDAVSVNWMVKPTGHTWDPAELWSFLRAGTTTNTTTTTTTAASLTSTAATTDLGELPERVRSALAIDTEDRSTDTARVIAACVREDMTVEDTRAAVRSRQDLRDRLDEPKRQRDDDVVRMYLKAMTTLQEERAARTINQELLAMVQQPHEAASAPVRAGEPGTPSPATTIAAGRPRLILAERVLTRSQLADLPSPQPLIEDTLDLRTVALLAGGWGTGKTFQAIDWAACIATGRIWQRRQVPQSGRVLYIASEGAYGFGSRVDAWEYGWRKKIADDVMTVLPVPVNLRDSGQVTELCELAAGCLFVVIDTLARCLVGADENSAKDMGEAVDALYRLRDATGKGTVLAVHHTGKDGETTRGSSALEAGVDTVYKTKGDARLIELQRTKRKDGPTEDRLHLTLKQTVESCVIVSAHGVDMTRSADRLLSIFRTHFADTGASMAQLRDVAAMANGTFHRAINELVRTGVLINKGTDQRPFYRLAEDQ